MQHVYIVSCALCVPMPVRRQACILLRFWCAMPREYVVTPLNVFQSSFCETLQFLARAGYCETMVNDFSADVCARCRKICLAATVWQLPIRCIFLQHARMIIFRNMITLLQRGRQPSVPIPNVGYRPLSKIRYHYRTRFTWIVAQSIARARFLLPESVQSANSVMSGAIAGTGTAS
jgi:hypothetical protein